ncbi:MAG: argininosuccinate lyase, partial [bacterium]
MTSTDTPSNIDNSNHANADNSDTNTLWGGRFSESTDEFVQAFTASVTFDQRMYRQDIAGSLAHSTMLMKSGVISEEDCLSIHD